MIKHLLYPELMKMLDDTVKIIAFISKMLEGDLKRSLVELVDQDRSEIIAQQSVYLCKGLRRIRRIICASAVIEDPRI